jgi:hypothetical protein
MSAESVADALQRAVAFHADRSSKVSRLNAEDAQKLRNLCLCIIGDLHANIIGNAIVNDLPPQAVFVAVVESISSWNEAINEIAGKPTHSKN